MKVNFHLSPALFGLTISFSLWGTVLGSILAGRIADRVERKKLIASCSLLYAADDPTHPGKCGRPKVEAFSYNVKIAIRSHPQPFRCDMIRFLRVIS